MSNWIDKHKKINVNTSWQDLIPKGTQNYINTKKVAIIDCDGILTNGYSYYNINGKELKSYGCYDKEMIKFLEKYCNWIFIFVSDDKKGYDITFKRIYDLQKSLYQKNYIQRADLVKEYISNGYITLFVGDSLSDINALSDADFSGTVNNSPDLVKEFCNYVSPKNGGNGGLADILYNVHLNIKDKI